MPYIDKNRRYLVDPMQDERMGFAETSGELNYQLTCVLLEYIQHKGMSYQTVNDIIGALEGAKLEFYRRQVAKYEDQKIIDNGDVY